MTSQPRRRTILRGLEGTEPDRPPPALTSDIHEEIFLRVGSPADLARASAACVSFRRLIRDPVFLRRYRSIHPPLLLGFISYAGFHPVEAPHPSAAVSRAVARAGRFSFDFVPPQTRFYWRPCDVRDGRVLVERRNVKKVGGKYCFSLELAVCDPLFRSYLLLPPMTDDLLASVELPNQDVQDSGASLIPSADMEETPFSVICWVYSDTKLVVFFFSSDSGHWTVSASTSWDDLGLYGGARLVSCQCVHGFCYWKVHIYTEKKLLKLDMSTMELSTYDFPPDHVGGGILIIAESGEVNVAMFNQVGACTSVDYYNLLQNGTEKSHEWHMKSTIPLPDQYTGIHFIDGPTEGYIFLAGTPDEQDLEVISLEIKSFKIERVIRKSSCMPVAIPYFGFPPSMSSRRIQ